VLRARSTQIWLALIGRAAAEIAPPSSIAEDLRHTSRGLEKVRGICDEDFAAPRTFDISFLVQPGGLKKPVQRRGRVKNDIDHRSCASRLLHKACGFVERKIWR